MDEKAIKYPYLYFVDPKTKSEINEYACVSSCPIKTSGTIDCLINSKVESCTLEESGAKTTESNKKNCLIFFS